MRAIHWFRSDLRLRDNAALSRAAAGADSLVCVFVLDPLLLTGPAAGAPRLRFLLASLERLARDLRARGQRLVLRHGDPRREIPRLLKESRAERLCWNRDYGPYARSRDTEVARAAEKLGVEVVHCKDRVLFESRELRTGKGEAYRVFTPYKTAWWRHYREAPPLPLGATRLPPPLRGVAAGKLPSLAALGVAGSAPELPGAGEAAARRRLDRFLETAVAHYARDRDRPAVDGTSRLSPYLRLGVISARSCVDRALVFAQEEPAARKGVRCWVDELIWRDFYHGILHENPQVLKRAFKPAYDGMFWNEDPEGFAAWCEGRTGYPFVDAGMRQLARLGWMHNRLRMVVASFLTKDLLIDWRLGERFFLERLVDGDPASNNGGWQWTASTGTDAQPWFRIFNPVAQGKRFDPDGAYVRRWVPELAKLATKFVHEPWRAPEPPVGYPTRVVDHAARRIEALRRYEAVVRGKKG